MTHWRGGEGGHYEWEGKKRKGDGGAYGGRDGCIGHSMKFRLPAIQPNDKSRQFMSSIRLITIRHVRISPTPHPPSSRHALLSIRHQNSLHSWLYRSRHRCRCSDHHPRRTQLPSQQRGIRSTVPVISRPDPSFILQMIHYESHETLSHALAPEGIQIALHGSHEARVWAALPAKGVGSPVPPPELKKIIGDEAAKVGQGRAFKNGWIAKDGDGLVKAVCQQRPAAPQPV